MEILNVLKDKVISAVKILEKQEILPSGLNKSLITIEKPKDESFGELSTNVSMVLAKDAGIRPRDLAAKIVDILRSRNIYVPVIGFPFKAGGSIVKYSFMFSIILTLDKYAS